MHAKLLQAKELWIFLLIEEILTERAEGMMGQIHVQFHQILKIKHNSY